MVILAWQAIITAGLIALAYTTSRKFSREIASKTALAAFKAETSSLAGMQADLEDRFTRFQKREGMRNARAAKQSDAELKQDAAALLAGTGTVNPMVDAAPGTHPKAALYAKLRGRA